MATRAQILRVEADLGDVMRYWAQAYELGNGELVGVEYAVTNDHPRRVWFKLTVRDEHAPAGRKEADDGD